MQPIVTDRVESSVGRSLTLVSPAKTAEPIEMLFELWTRVGPGNHVLDVGPDPHGKSHQITHHGQAGNPLTQISPGTWLLHLPVCV